MKCTLALTPSQSSHPDAALQVTHPEQLCKGYPSEFRDYFAHCLSLGFEDRPDYRFTADIHTYIHTYIHTHMDMK